jgi:hypothetical protein
MPGSRLERLLEAIFVPPVGGTSARDDVLSGSDAPLIWIDDFRRVVAVVSITAVGFLIPSLFLADVPPDRWLTFVAAAASVGLFVGGSFYVISAGSPWSMPAAAVNCGMIAWLAVLYHPHYNELGLLYAMIVSGHAIVHGIRAALVASLLGAILIPYIIQAGQPISASDPGYALIYLTGAALIPWTAGRLARRRAAALRTQLAVTIATEREAVMILARAAEAKDHVTGDHVVRVGDIAAAVGLRTGMTALEVEDLRFAGMLHDVGKLHVPDHLLSKRGPLTEDEWVVVKQHTVWGERILGSSAGFELARVICRSHHENWNGSGYPDALQGAAIPLAARIVRLADVFDALRSERPYKEAWGLERSLEEIMAGAEKLFDPDLAKELVALFEGDRVRLAAGFARPAGAPTLSRTKLRATT